MIRLVKKILFVFPAISLGVLVAGCNQDPVSSSDVGYNEIRIDAFTHYWTTQKARATIVRGNTLITIDENSSYTSVDTLALKTPDLFKSTGQPESMLEGTRVIYKSNAEPKVFSCYYYNNGKQVNSSYWNPDVEEDVVIPPVYFLRRTVMTSGLSEEQDGPLELYSREYFFLEDAPVSVQPIPCGYFPGKGFYLGLSGIDYYGLEYNSTGGEFVIRY